MCLNVNIWSQITNITKFHTLELMTRGSETQLQWGGGVGGGEHLCFNVALKQLGLNKRGYNTCVNITLKTQTVSQHKNNIGSTCRAYCDHTVGCDDNSVQKHSTTYISQYQSIADNRTPKLLITPFHPCKETIECSTSN